jgi:hypothetical protein
MSHRHLGWRAEEEMIQRDRERERERKQKTERETETCREIEL